MKYGATILAICFLFNSIAAQIAPKSPGIDYLLAEGNYEKVIDTCKHLLASDNVNPELCYKIGLAYQDLQEIDSAVIYFYRSHNLDLENKLYAFMLAKSYYNKEQYSLAEPLLLKLHSTDPLRWIYAYYLTSTLMNSDKIDQAIKIYQKFLSGDSTNCLYLDKLGYANLRKGNFEDAILYYNRSLSICQRNLPAIKNLAYLYAYSRRSDIALQLLTRGIKIDSTDMDLYLSRANIFYAKSQTKRALDDYLKILASGDTTKQYLKRIGIGYCNTRNPKESIHFLMKAYELDTTDNEICSYLGQSYYNIGDMPNSIRFYNKAIDNLIPLKSQLAFSYILCAQSQSTARLYKEAVSSYIESLQIKNNPNLYGILASLYDERLKDRSNAVFYYQKVLDAHADKMLDYSSEYIESVKKRLDYLKSNPSKY
jgi:tetratricopeptide (TPR) repeat protein